MKPNNTEPVPTTRDVLVKLVLAVGSQVTEDYQSKDGLWEGMSIRNQQSLDEAEAQLQRICSSERLDEATKARDIADDHSLAVTYLVLAKRVEALQTLIEETPNE